MVLMKKTMGMCQKSFKEIKLRASVFNCDY
jgi:hypothetical protein